MRCWVKSFNERNPHCVLLRAVSLHSHKTAGDELEEGGDDVKSSWPLWAGLHMCYNGHANGKQGCKAERILKNDLSPDCSLQLENMKLESLVIADQHAAVNMYPGLVLTARHTLGMNFALSIEHCTELDFHLIKVISRSVYSVFYHGGVRDWSEVVTREGFGNELLDWL